jgi:hypothetical protein
MKVKINLATAIVVSRPQRNPLLLSRACQVVFGKIRTIHWGRVVGTYDRNRALIAFAPQHVCGRQTSSTSPDKHNGAWSVGYSLGNRW